MMVQKRIFDPIVSHPDLPKYMGDVVGVYSMKFAEKNTQELEIFALTKEENTHLKRDCVLVISWLFHLYTKEVSTGSTRSNLPKRIKLDFGV